jgi:serine protease Do
MRPLHTLRALAVSVALGGVALTSSVRADLPLPPVSTTSAAKAANPRAWNLRQSPPVEVVRRVKDAVVNIHSERTVRGNTEELLQIVPSQSRVNGMGTGIVIDPRGYIVTNHHVVEDVSSLRVRLADGTVVAARVVARDAESDLAILKINVNKPLAVMPLGTAKDLQVAETVVAIGNAYGYDHTVTVGVISALGRDVNLNKVVRYRSLIQTDAAINPGNSGGPLINLNGELIGVNVAIRAGAQGIGFAIPVDSMIATVSQMMAKIRTAGEVGPVGLQIRDDVPGLASERRVVVDRADGAAEKAGLRKGDVLTRVADQEIACSLDLERALLDRTAGQKLAVVVSRDGSTQRLTLELEASASGVAGTLTSANPGDSKDTVWRQLGVRLQVVENSADVSRAFPQLHGGLRLTDVRLDSAASRAGLKSGDILVGLHQWEMTTMDNVLYVLNHADRMSFSPLRFFIIRAGQVHRGLMTPAE